MKMVYICQSYDQKLSFWRQWFIVILLVILIDHLEGYNAADDDDDDGDNDDDVLSLWCRRKKRCIRFLDTADNCDSPLRASAAALADSTSDMSVIPQPNDVTMTSARDHRGPGFPTADTKQTVGSSPLHRITTVCDSSAPSNSNNQLHWTSCAPGISHLMSPTSASVRWRRWSHLHNVSVANTCSPWVTHVWIVKDFSPSCQQAGWRYDKLHFVVIWI